MERIVMKFGGTSMSTSQSWQQVKDIVENSTNVCAIVVSAPGKSAEYSQKITDLLKSISVKRAAQENWNEVFKNFTQRFHDIATQLSLNTVRLAKDFENIESRINEGCSEPEILSRGEFLTAKLFAEYCGIEFVDAYDVVVISSEGKPVFDKKDVPKITQSMVVPGYYGRGVDGSLAVFSRGGSDVTGAYLAVKRGATYERWSDTPVCFTDPSVVNDARIVDELTYAELGNITTVVPDILHPSAARVCINNGVTVYVKNTQNPSGTATRITRQRDYTQHPIAGVHVQNDYTSFTLQQIGIDESVGHVYTLSSIFKDFNIPIRTVSGGGDSIVFFIHQDYILSGDLEKIKKITENHHSFNNPTVTVREGISFVSVVGDGMIDQYGYFARIYNALAQAHVSVVSTGSPPSEGVIEIFVSEKDSKQVVEMLYNEFV